MHAQRSTRLVELVQLPKRSAEGFAGFGAPVMIIAALLHLGQPGTCRITSPGIASARD